MALQNRIPGKIGRSIAKRQRRRSSDGSLPFTMPTKEETKRDVQPLIQEHADQLAEHVGSGLLAVQARCSNTKIMREQQHINYTMNQIKTCALDAQAALVLATVVLSTTDTLKEFDTMLANIAKASTDSKQIAQLLYKYARAFNVDLRTDFDKLFVWIYKKFGVRAPNSVASIMHKGILAQLDKLQLTKAIFDIMTFIAIAAKETYLDKIKKAETDAAKALEVIQQLDPKVADSYEAFLLAKNRLEIAESSVAETERLRMAYEAEPDASFEAPYPDNADVYTELTEAKLDYERKKTAFVTLSSNMGARGNMLKARLLNFEALEDLLRCLVRLYQYTLSSYVFLTYRIVRIERLKVKQTVLAVGDSLAISEAELTAKADSTLPKLNAEARQANATAQQDRAAQLKEEKN